MYLRFTTSPQGFFAVSSYSVVVVVVFALKTVLTSIQYLLFLTLQGKKTNFRCHRLTKNKVYTEKTKIKRPRESANTCEKICNRFLKITVQKNKKVRAGKPQKGSRAHRSNSEAESQTKYTINMYMYVWS